METFYDKATLDLTTPDVFQYYKGLSDRTIIINEVIDSDMLERVMLPLIEMDNDGTGEPITLILNTEGGAVFAGMPLCDMIDQVKTPLTIVVPMYAFSMGSLILMAGFNNPNVTKKCYKHSVALIHAGSTYLDGDASAVRDTFKFNERYEQMIHKYIVSHSKISEEQYEKMERYEWYMTSDDMLELGIVDEVIGA